MKKEVKIGIIGITALAMLIFGINYLKGVQMFQSSSCYYVEYTNINGLANSSPVFASGYKIGLVRDIQYNHANPGHALVPGIIGALLLGFGMSLVMSDLSRILGFNQNMAMLLGIIAGMIGIALVCSAYPLYNQVTRKERVKIAPEILQITEELMK